MSSTAVITASPGLDNKNEMEEELRMTRKDLETTKQALKIQAARCRHLVAAFTKKLAEKDAQLKSHRERREKELSGLLRALLVLEARLRREQKSIKELLAEKDNVINEQKLEIARLESEANNWVGATMKKEIIVETTEILDSDAPVETPRGGGGTYAKPDLITSLGLPDGSNKSEGPDSLSSESTRSCGDEHDFTVVTPPQKRGILNVHDRSAFSPISKTKSPPDVSSKDDLNKPRTLLQEVRIGSRPDKYHDNPVLQCVNQILLKDQEDFLEEQRNLRSKDGDAAIKTYGWLDEEDSPLDSDLQDDLVQPQSPEAEKENIDKEKHVRLNPPLPPKPKVSPPKKVEFSDFKTPNVQFHNPPMVLPPPQAIDPAQLNIPLSILDQGQDKDLYVISNSALDDDIVKQLRGRTLNVSGLQIKSPRMNADRNQHSNVPSGLLHPNHKPHTKPSTESTSFPTNELFSPPRTSHQVNNSVLKVNIQESPKPAPSFPFKSPPKVGLPNMIKVASPVATLLTSAGGAQETQAPSVSQMVRRFEDLGSKKTDDEEEDLTKKDDSIDTSSSGANDLTASPSSVSYDNFLEATGLSQKSIMTPSRMMTNHRNVTKPKDVKLRSRVRSSGVIERCIPPQVVGPTIKYWTEPYL